jgi:hypothetical protein
MSTEELPASCVPGKRVRVRHPYEAGSPKELDLAKDDSLSVLREHPSGWWKAALMTVDADLSMTGPVGLLPRNFVTELTFVAAVRAKYAYDGDPKLNQLSLAKGQVVWIISMDKSGWWKGDSIGRVGLLPMNFVEVLDEAAAEAAAKKVVAAVAEVEARARRGTKAGSAVTPAVASAAATASDATGSDSSSRADAAASTTPAADRVIAMYDFEAKKPNQLSMKANDVIVVIDRDPSGWWKGQLDGKTGRFPRNFTSPYKEPASPAGAKKVKGGSVLVKGAGAAADAAVPHSPGRFRVSAAADSRTDEEEEEREREREREREAEKQGGAGEEEESDDDSSNDSAVRVEDDESDESDDGEVVGADESDDDDDVEVEAVDETDEVESGEVVEDEEEEEAADESDDEPAVVDATTPATEEQQAGDTTKGTVTQEAVVAAGFSTIAEYEAAVTAFNAAMESGELDEKLKIARDLAAAVGPGERRAELLEAVFLIEEEMKRLL